MQVIASSPLCRASYPSLGAQIIAEREDAHLLFLECPRCSCGMVALVTLGASGQTSIGAVTDLTKREIANWPGTDSVTVNLVLDLYRWLGTHHYFFHS